MDAEARAACLASWDQFGKRCEALSDGTQFQKYRDHQKAEQTAICDTYFASMQAKLAPGVALLGEQGATEETGIDWSAAAIGAGVGFVAGYALMKAFRRKGDDEFSRV